MKKIAFPFMILALLCFAIDSNSQCTPLTTAKASGLVLKFQATNGTNGSAVVWNPMKKVYYAAIAGNTEFPIETFDKMGNPIATASTGVDLRGLWWNSNTSQLEGNNYESGWTVFSLDGNGSANGDSQVLCENCAGPDPQSVGTYNPTAQKVVFYNEGAIYSESSSGKLSKGKKIKGLPADPSDINAYSIIYTGCKGYEYGVLNFSDGKVYLLSAKGKYMSTVNLPSDVVVDYSFWVSYANGQLFLYNSDTREWTGYKICQN